MLALLGLLGLLAALAPEAPPPPPLTPAPRAVVVRVDARLSGLEALLRSEPRVPGEARVRGEATPSRLRGMARTLVERARVRLAAGDADAADQLGAAASDTLSADRPMVLLLRLPSRAAPRAPAQPGSPAAVSAPAGVPPAAAPPGGLPPGGSVSTDPPPFWFSLPQLPPGFGPPGFSPPHGFGGLPEFDRPPSAAERAARHLDHAAAMLAMTGRFAERGDAATLAGLARTALDAARRALAAADPAGATAPRGGPRRWPGCAPRRDRGRPDAAPAPLHAPAAAAAACAGRAARATGAAGTAGTTNAAGATRAAGPAGPAGGVAVSVGLALRTELRVAPALVTFATLLPLDVEALEAYAERERALNPWLERSASDLDGEAVARVAARPRLSDHLAAQLAARPLAPAVRRAAAAIVGSLDGEGYLREPLDALGALARATPADVERALRAVQGCEPAGVGARDLGERLLLQAAAEGVLDDDVRLLCAQLEALAAGGVARVAAASGHDLRGVAARVCPAGGARPRPAARVRAAGRVRAARADLHPRRQQRSGASGGLSVALDPAPGRRSSSRRSARPRAARSPRRGGAR